MESVQVTDMGTNVRLSMTATSLFSMRGNFVHSDIGRNNHVILRYINTRLCYVEIFTRISY